MTISEVKSKIEYYCAYQERCHQEVFQKLKSMKISNDEIDEVIVYLIENNFLNETRFAQSFVRGKHRIKKWGKTRLINELKQRKISQRNINIGLKEIESEYEDTFNEYSEKVWQNILEINILKKRKKFYDTLLRKGFESDLIYSFLTQI